MPRPPAPLLTFVLALALAALLPLPGVSPPRSAEADEPEAAGPDAGPPAPAPDDPELGLIQGDRVNVRVGPRIDNRPVTQLGEGAVVLILEQKGEWLGVRVPEGFPAAVSLDYVTREGPDAVRVAVGDLNLRVEPPTPGKPAPGIFLDRPARGALLPLIEVAEPPPPPPPPPPPEPPVAPPEGAAPVAPEGTPQGNGWGWVIAPEEIRVFVHERYVRRMGKASEHPDLLAAARALREQATERLSTARRSAAARESATRLISAVGAAQQELGRLRKEGGTDKTPIVALANGLDAALESEAQAAEQVLRLARALREDLEREIVLRVARHDAEMARLQGREAPAVPALEAVAEQVTESGEIRYEPTPGWTEEGIYLLFVDERPRFVLRLTTGGPLPHPDFRAHVGAGPRRVLGRRPGERLFGLPVLEVRVIQ